jgi:hypothetical protein
MPVKKKVEHGIEAAVYANDGLGHKPLIVCLCGWSSGVGCCVSWGEAGGDFDDHLAEVEE